MIDPRVKWPPPLALPSLTPSTASLIDRVHCADALDFLRRLPSNFVNCIVTSPPYFGLRDYGIAGQIGLEDTPAAYVERLRVLFAEARRVLRDNGVLWLNLGDSYGSSSSGQNFDPAYHASNGGGQGPAGTFGHVRKGSVRGMEKQLLMIPARVAIALQDDGWILRSDVIWHKPNPMPESVRDRPTKAHEYVFVFAKSPRYWYDAEAIREPARDWGPRDRSNFRGGITDPLLKHHGFTNGDWAEDGRNARTVWTIPTQGNALAHFAMMPPELARRCILAGCPRGGLVLDPFMGAGTTAKVAISEQRHYIGSELNPEYVDIANGQLAQPIAVSLFDMARAL